MLQKNEPAIFFYLRVQALTAAAKSHRRYLQICHWLDTASNLPHQTCSDISFVSHYLLSDIPLEHMMCLR